MTDRDYKLPNFSTQVEPTKSAQEVTELLRDFGADGIYMQYRNGEPSGLEFHINVDEKPITFRLPVHTDRLYAVLLEMRRLGKCTASQSTVAHAQRVGWRILKDWVRAQLGLMKTEMVQAHELLLPWAVMVDGDTVSDHMLNPSKGLRMLTGGTDDES